MYTRGCIFRILPLERWGRYGEIRGDLPHLAPRAAPQPRRRRPRRACRCPRRSSGAPRVLALGVLLAEVRRKGEKWRRVVTSGDLGRSRAIWGDLGRCSPEWGEVRRRGRQRRAHANSHLCRPRLERLLERASAQPDAVHPRKLLPLDVLADESRDLRRHVRRRLAKRSGRCEWEGISLGSSALLVAPGRCRCGQRWLIAFASEFAAAGAVATDVWFLRHDVTRRI